MFCNGETIENVRTISAYSSASELIEDYDLLPAALSANEDFCDYLQSFDDYEAVAYFCINGDTVLCADSVNGDLFSVCSADEFIKGIVEQYENDYC